MKKLMILLIAVLATTSAHAADQKVLMIVRGDGDSLDLELMLTKEVRVMKEMLEQAGFEVVAATASGQPLAAGTATLKPDLKLADVKVAEYIGFILPCMAVGTTPEPEPASLTIVKEAVADGKPVAAQLGGIRTLATAGVLSGKKYAFVSEDAAKEYGRFGDSVHNGDGIVQDGKIITSGICPYVARNGDRNDGTLELTKALIAELAKD